MSRRLKILLADDDHALIDILKMSLQDRFDVLTASTVAEALMLAKSHPIDVGIFDLCFDGQKQDGILLIDFFNREQPDVPLLVLSGDQSTRRVVEATRRKLVDFIPKGSEFKTLLDIGLRRASGIRNAQTQVSSEFKTRSPRMLKTLSDVDRILRAPGDHPILILGESGTEKEFLANFIASRSRKKLVAANMAAIPKETAESELFGHEKGAFTGAFANKSGLIEQAHQGVFFLDELGECDLGIQSKLLRALQNKEIQPVGSPRTKKIDVRFIAATNRDIHSMVAAGEFRLDLLARLDTFTVRIPNLRERPEDIQLYAEMFLKQYGGGQSYQITADGLDFLLSHHWPGNIRDLRSAVLRIVVLSDRRVIDRAALVDAIGDTGETIEESRVLDPISHGTVGDAVARSQRLALIRALDETRGNKTKAAQALGIHVTTIHRWIKQYGLSKEA